MRKDRIRIVGAEPCGRCGVKRKERCKDYRGRPKATCRVVIGCRRCAAQRGRCRHPERTMRQCDLFPPSHPAWVPSQLLAAVGTTGDDARRSIR